jgi:hypothetical protein
MICSAFAIHQSARTMRNCDVISGTTSTQYFVHATTRSSSAIAARITVALGLQAGDTQWRVVGHENLWSDPAQSERQRLYRQLGSVG